MVVSASECPGGGGVEGEEVVAKKRGFEAAVGPANNSYHQV